MDSKRQNGSLGARLAWVFFTPVVLALAAFSRIGILLIPALCIYLDGRSRTYAAAACVLTGAVAAALLWGPAVAAVSAFAVITTAAAYVLKRIKQPFQTGLAGSAVGGVLGAVALLGILVAALGRPLGEAGAQFLFNGFNVPLLGAGQYDYLDLLAAQVKSLQQGQSLDLLSQLLNPLPPTLTALPDAEKAALLIPIMESGISQLLPGLALVTGLLTGGLGYYLPVMALSSRRRWLAEAGGTGIDVPPFASFKLPKYVVISIFLLQLVTSFGAEDGTVLMLYRAASMLFNVLMTLQALGLLSYMLNRKKVYGWLQALILAPALLFLFWLMPWVGFFDALFDVRSVLARVDALKAKGKQVFTQGGLDELRKMDRSGKSDQNGKGGKNGKDGEDGET